MAQPANGWIRVDSTSATVTTIILAFRRKHEMLKEKAERALAASRFATPCGVVSRQIRIRFRAAASFIVTRLLLSDALKLFLSWNVFPA